MAPQLKRIITTRVKDVVTLSIWQRVTEKQDSHTIRDPEVREMVDDLMEFNRYKIVDYEESNKTNRWAKDLPTDEEFEKFSVWKKEKTPVDHADMESNGGSEAEALFDQYVHHHYIKRWGLLIERTGKDEEWWIPNPPMLDENDPNYLCDMCRHINFRALLSQRGLPGNELPGPTKIMLHGLDRMLRKEKCAFCRLISRKIRDDHILDLENQEAIEGTDLWLNVLDDGPENALRLEVELRDKRHHAQRIIIQMVHLEFHKPFHGILVDHEAASMEAIRKWIMLCEDTHPKTTNSCVDQKRSRLKLIDVDEKRIVEVECPCRYVCLSYVWGKSGQPQYNARTKSAFEASNGLGIESVSLPQTITDAMVVARQLGVRYLWIDALCIQQDEEEEKAAIIANMGAIYSNAILTIVASTNSDPYGGLPGVTTKHRTKAQICGTVQGMLLAVAFHDHRKPLNDVEESVWNSRAWTYQERHLSQRISFFTDSQICFICPHARFFEDTHPLSDPDFKVAPIEDKTKLLYHPQDIWFKIWSDPTQYRYINKGFEMNGRVTVMSGEDDECEADQSELTGPIYQFKKIPDSDTSGILEIRGRNLWDIYRQTVDSYTRRNMTFDRDAISAFTGMMELMCQGANTKFWYGLPAFAFDQALLWYPQEPLQRRNQDGHNIFPSWSWAGWKGHCHYRSRGWHNGLYRCPVSAVHWFRKLNAIEWFAKFDLDSLTGLPEHISVEELQLQIITGRCALFDNVDAIQLYHLSCTEDGWEVNFDTERNQHSYMHEQYPNLSFNYPIPLPDQDVIVIPDEEGLLHFEAHSSKVRFCDMWTTGFEQRPGIHHILQIGLGDETRSSNLRPIWQRIIYHQGYRAGFLMLNIPFEDINLEALDEYRLLAMSRDELPSIAPPTESWIFYLGLGPVELHRYVGLRQEWVPEDLYKTIEPPNEAVTPDTSPKSENGDAYWDEYRFKDVVFPLYNVLLVRQKGRFWERIGVGRIHYHAFHHSRPEFSMISLK